MQPPDVRGLSRMNLPKVNQIGILSELIVTTLKGLRMPHGKLIMDIGCITGDVERVEV